MELYQQTNARLWRQGQKQTVVIHHIISKGTIDENVMVELDEKYCDVIVHRYKDLVGTDEDITLVRGGQKYKLSDVEINNGEK